MAKEFQYGTYTPLSRHVTKSPICNAASCKFVYPCDNSTICDGYLLNLKQGKYMFEAFGAVGGHTSQFGGLGGYAAAQITIEKNLEIFLYIGGKGCNGCKMSIFNGGGKGTAASGGGATDFRLKIADYASRFLIAGGGGGTNGGNEYDGGGLDGGISSNGNKKGGQQTPNEISGEEYGTFGKGGDGYVGGGGGLYGGDAGFGGSGFVYSDQKLTQDIRKITEIKISDGNLLSGVNFGPGYAIISSLSTSNSSQAKCECQAATCFCQPYSHSGSPMLFFASFFTHE